MNTLERACKTLSLANTYAEDGAVMTAIELTSEALALLCKERRRRTGLGLLPTSREEGKRARKAAKP